MKHTMTYPCPGQSAIWKLLLTLLLVLALPASARAQDEDDEESWTEDGEDEDDGQDGDADDLTFDEDNVAPARGVPPGAGETPNVPPEFDAVPPESEAKPAVVREKGYPLALTRRPLTLEAGMSELTGEIPLFFSPVRALGVLRGRYGIDDRIEFGLRYSPGAVAEEGSIAGRTVAIEGQYRIFDWLAAQLSVPVLLDPVAVGVFLGAPMKFRIGDKAALFFGRDLLSFRIHGFVPEVEDPLLTAARADARDINTVLPRGDIRLIGGAIYQLEPNLAFTAELGLVAADFALTDAGVPLRAALVYSTSNKVDLGARLGWTNLDQAGESFGAAVFATFRL